MKLTFVFEPWHYFESKLSLRPNWIVAAAGPLLCFLLHWFSFCVIHNKLTHQVETDLGDRLAVLISAKWIYVMDFFGAAGYVLMPIFAATIVACVDILARQPKKLDRFFEFTGLSFYSLLPYLLSVLLLALAFDPPAMKAVGPISNEDIRSTIQDFMISVRATPTILLITNLGILFDGWLAILIANSYRSVNQCSRTASIATSIGVFGMIVLTT